MNCIACTDGIVIVTVRHPRTDREYPAAFRCACPAGAMKSGKIPSILTLDPEILRGIYTDGVPAASGDDVWRARLAKARIPTRQQGFTLASYAAAFPDDAMAAKYAIYGQHWIAEPIETRSDLVLYGPQGTGKTGLAIALLRASIEQGSNGVVWTVAELSREWRDLFRPRSDQEDTPSEKDFVTRIVAADVLVLDEIAGVKLTEFVEQSITGIVDARQKVCRPTILTLNLTAEQMRSHEAIVLTTLLGPTLQDRLRERAQFWPISGASKRTPYRGKK